MVAVKIAQISTHFRNLLVIDLLFFVLLSTFCYIWRHAHFKWACVDSLQLNFLTAVCVTSFFFLIGTRLLLICDFFNHTWSTAFSNWLSCSLIFAFLNKRNQTQGCMSHSNLRWIPVDYGEVLQYLRPNSVNITTTVFSSNAFLYLSLFWFFETVLFETKLLQLFGC